MKQFRNVALTLGFLTLAFSSCKKKSEDPQPAEKLYEVQFSVAPQTSTTSSIHWYVVCNKPFTGRYFSSNNAYQNAIQTDSGYVMEQSLADLNDPEAISLIGEYKFKEHSGIKWYCQNSDSQSRIDVWVDGSHYYNRDYTYSPFTYVLGF